MPLPKNTKQEGRLGEDLAARILISQGYRIIDRNFRSRFGEIDLIAEQGEFLVFVEVKMRQNTKFGLPQESVTPSKLNKIKKTIDYYLLIHRGLTLKIRIDIVALEKEASGNYSWKIITVD